MKIAIAGAGITGSYLYKLLSNRGHKVDLFDKKPRTKCGLSPCAWGTSRGFDVCVRATELEPKKYILQHSDHVVMDEFAIEADLSTFDKSSLVKDLRRGSKIKYFPLERAKYERVIDATGVSRAFLPPIEEDIILPCVQWRIRTDERLENRIKLGGIGFAWCFPLSHHEYHVGCGSLLSDPHQIVEELGWVRNPTSQGKGNVICKCAGQIRLTAPQYAQPFVVDHGGDEIWGVGEAIGCVAPLAGDGIVPGMRSVQILMKYWNDPHGYREAILSQFAWMKSEREVVDKLRTNKRLGMKDAWVLRSNSRRMAMKVGLREARALLERLG